MLATLEAVAFLHNHRIISRDILASRRSSSIIDRCASSRWWRSQRARRLRRCEPWTFRLPSPSPAAHPRSRSPTRRSCSPTRREACADIECLIENAYAKRSPRRRRSRSRCTANSGSVAGVGPDEIMDGGYRGKIHLVPQLPTGEYRKHLEWVARRARRSIDEFFAKLYDKQPAPELSLARAPAAVRALGRQAHAERVRDRLARRVQRRGLAAHDRDGVRETSSTSCSTPTTARTATGRRKTLQKDYDAIVAKCPARTIKCLAPYAPNDTEGRAAARTTRSSRTTATASTSTLPSSPCGTGRSRSEMLAKGKLAQAAVQVRPRRERAGRGRRSSTSSSRGVIQHRHADIATAPERCCPRASRQASLYPCGAERRGLPRAVRVPAPETHHADRRHAGEHGKLRGHVQRRGRIARAAGRGRRPLHRDVRLARHDRRDRGHAERRAARRHRDDARQALVRLRRVPDRERDRDLVRQRAVRAVRAHEPHRDARAAGHRAPAGHHAPTGTTRPTIAPSTELAPAPASPGATGLLFRDEVDGWESARPRAGSTSCAAPRSCSRATPSRPDRRLVPARRHRRPARGRRRTDALAARRGADGRTSPAPHEGRRGADLRARRVPRRRLGDPAGARIRDRGRDRCDSVLGVAQPPVLEGLRRRIDELGTSARFFSAPPNPAMTALAGAWGTLELCADGTYFDSTTDASGATATSKFHDAFTTAWTHGPSVRVDGLPREPRSTGRSSSPAHAAPSSSIATRCRSET